LKVSIIIRTKNEESWLKACLSSLSTQTVKEFEIILVDNESTDRTVDVAKSCGVSKIVTVHHYLPGDALNRGVELATGNVLVFLSAHCIPVNNYWLEKLIKPVVDKICVASYGRQIPTPATNAENARDLLMVFGTESVIQKNDCKFHNANSCIDAVYFDKFKFDPKITNVEDWYWAKLVIERRDQIAYAADSVVFHHHGINQHQEGASFRSIPVADLLSSLHLSGAEKPTFMKGSAWNGLAIVSCADTKSTKLINLLEANLDDSFNVDVCATGNGGELKGSNFFSSDKSQTFYDYLLATLNHFEAVNDKIYDFIIFVDGHYAEIDLDLINLNVSQLFSEWVDVSTAARKITGWTFSEKNSSKISNVNDRSNTDSIEALLGQGSAMRTSVLRRGVLEQSNIFISSIVNRRLAVKRN
jgi:glycosyltransferase involved in cell wall biosynthesis